MVDLDVRGVDLVMDGALWGVRRRSETGCFW